VSSRLFFTSPQWGEVDAVHAKHGFAMKAAGEG
jgi:hypothetical protein